MHLRNANPKRYYSTYSFTHEFGVTHESKDLLVNYMFLMHLNILKTCEIGSKTVLFNSVLLKVYWSCIMKFWLIILNYHFLGKCNWLEKRESLKHNGGITAWWFPTFCNIFYFAAYQYIPSNMCYPRTFWLPTNPYLNYS